MMVRPTRSFPGAAFLFTGTAFSHIWPWLVALAAYSIVLVWLYPSIHGAKSLTLTPFTLTGLALSIFLGFRNNACYDRWWEARKLWGLQINTTRGFTRQVATLIDTDAAGERALVYRIIAFTHALRLHLRRELDRLDEITGLLGADEVERLKGESNVPNAILHSTGEQLRDLWRAGKIDTFHMGLLEETLTTFSNIQGGCERIKNTPVPLAYTTLTHRIVGLYCLALPFGLVDIVGNFTPAVTLIVSFAFLGLDAVGSQIEDPFEEDPNDLPLAAISRMIEIELRQRLGETDLPSPLEPKGGVLL